MLRPRGLKHVSSNPFIFWIKVYVRKVPGSSTGRVACFGSVYTKAFGKVTSTLFQLFGYSSLTDVIKHGEKIVSTFFFCSGDLGYILAQLLSIVTEFVCGRAQSRKIAEQ
jgi:hypothetical protein